jgi:hypothetical protein
MTGVGQKCLKLGLEFGKGVVEVVGLLLRAHSLSCCRVLACFSNAAATTASKLIWGMFMFMLIGQGIGMCSMRNW